MIEAHPARREPRTSLVLFYVILILAAAIYYLFLMMDGTLNFSKPVELAARGMIFNSMLEHLLHGEFDVDPAAVAFEGVVRDGKTYTYLGILPALLRLPLLPFGALAWLDVTGLYSALAATVALCFKLASVALINDKLPKSRLQAIAFFVIVLSLLLGGAQIQFLRASVYDETLAWAGAISAAFIYCALRGLIAKRAFSTGLIAVMASLAGLVLLTRVPTALGLYSGVGLLLLVLAWPVAGPLRDRLPRFVRGLVSTRTLVGLALLLGFVIGSGIVNYQRWGNPLAVSGDPHTYISFMAAPGRIARVEAYGLFNIARLWYGVLYYFFPIWTIIRPDGQFLFSAFETWILDGVELPPSSFLMSDPLFLVLGGAFLLRLRQLAHERLLDLRAAAALMVGFLIPVFLILTFMYMAFRYRMEFYPFLEFAAFLGFYAICINPGQFSPASRSRLSLVLIASAGFGIVYSHLLLFLYKISPPGNYANIGTDTSAVSPANRWVNYYYFHLKEVFPSIAQRLHW
jgi:hypothetical protein